MRVANGTVPMFNCVSEAEGTDKKIRDECKKEQEVEEEEVGGGEVRKVE